MTELKKYIVISERPPNAGKNGMVKDVTKKVEQTLDKSESDIEDYTPYDLLDDILLLEQQVIEIINNTNNIDCSCFKGLKSCFNGNKNIGSK